ncbi:hydrolase [Micromonospora sp. WMMD987]|uniref:hydrolase n=1 Tax=Micromonospora sp. WMMD987 TaxID=3016089 RepID=UPI00249A4D4C|nr:hydrolase [Micromonospora sp. WMMD987]WFE96733.1 hydrolase [Micromonospora sp. WMMD987]
MLTVPDDLLARAAATAAGADATGRLHEDVVEGVRVARFARHFVPAEWGGTAGGFGELVDASATLAASCTSAAWCATLFAAHGRLAAYLPAAGRQDVWGSSPDVLIAASVVPPQGVATPAPGGWRLDGTWRYASGVEWAGWVLLAAWTGESEHRLFAVPAAEVSVESTWDALGLRGTGSHSVVVHGVSVPAHRTFTLDDLTRPSSPSAARCHSVPYPLVASLLFAAPVWGSARSAVHEAAAGDPPAPGSAQERALGAAATRVETAGLLMRQASARADDSGAGPPETGLNRLTVPFAAQLCREAVDGLWAAAGTRGVAGGALQRRWRDVLTAVRHPMLDPEAGAAAWVRAHATRHRSR